MKSVFTESSEALRLALSLLYFNFKRLQGLTKQTRMLLNLGLAHGKSARKRRVPLSITPSILKTLQNMKAKKKKPKTIFTQVLQPLAIILTE